MIDFSMLDRETLEKMDDGLQSFIMIHEGSETAEIDLKEASEIAACLDKIDTSFSKQK
jgi:hypothetical protein